MGFPIENETGVALFPIKASNFVSESTLIVANSPLTLDVAATIKDLGNRGYIANDSGANSFTVEISRNGVQFLTAFTIKPGEIFDLTGYNISKIKLTRVGGDAAYRIQVW